MGLTWDVEDVLDGDDVTTIYERIDTILDDLTGYENSLDGIPPSELVGFLKRYESLRDELKRLSTYYTVRFAQDTGDTDVLAAQKQFSQRAASISNELLFFDDWFRQLDSDEQQRYIDAEELQNYSYYLKQLRDQASYMLGREAEEALTVKSTTTGELGDLYDTITGEYTFELDGEELTRDELKTHMRSADPSRRENAYNEHLRVYQENATVLGELYSLVANDWRNEATTIRGYASSIARRSEPQDINEEAVKTLMSVVRENRGVFHEYFDLKFDILDDLDNPAPRSREHVYAPLQADTTSYSFNEAKNLVLDTYEAFDPRFHDAAKAVFDDEHVHSHPQQGKRGGAFCADTPTGKTPYVMLNYDSTIEDVTTMAHELGHAVHDVFAREQTPLNRSPALPMAETASIFAETMVTDRLRKEADTAEDRVALLGDFLDSQFASVLRQVYFTEFERQAHEALRDGASHDDLDDIYADLLHEQFGPIDVPDAFAIEWRTIPHIYHYPFYCYAYAWGNLFVLSLYDAYRERGSAFIDDYLDLLRAGGSEPPADLLARFGFDPEDEAFWQRGFSLIQEYIDELRNAHDDLER